MEYQNEHIRQLWQRFLSDRATAAEVRELFMAINDPAAGYGNDWLYDQMQQAIPVDKEKKTSNRELSIILQTMATQDDSLRQALGRSARAVSIQHWWRYAAAAVLVAALGIGGWMQLHQSDRSMATSNTAKQDKAPGGNKALLTLADGSTIVLDSANNGLLASQGNAQIVKLANGQIAYNLKGQPQGGLMINKITTPRGGQYQLTLPDGTKAWLNAVSSITYPAAFTGTKREVKIAGEVYFDVAKDDRKPFTVNVEGRSTILVLGTQFNVNSYMDEGNIHTTLVDGSIRISNTTGRSVLLKPGQQAVQHKNEQQIAVADNVNISQALAWKEGYFNLQDASLEQVMRQLERWYDISVSYEGAIRQRKFQGKINRGVKLSSVLEWFSTMGISSRIEGDTLVLSAK